MKTMLMMMLAGLISMMVAMPALAEFDEEDLKEIEMKLKEGKGFTDSDFYPDGRKNNQILTLRANPIWYTIDFQSRICFAQRGSASILIPCQAIKIGYPKIGKFITWEKDGHAE